MYHLVTFAALCGSVWTSRNQNSTTDLQHGTNIALHCIAWDGSTQLKWQNVGTIVATKELKHVLERERPGQLKSQK